MMIPQDKQLHLAVGVVLGLLPIGHPVAGLLLATFAGLGKEVWDHYNPPHVPDPFDFLATVVGGLAGALLGMAL